MPPLVRAGLGAALLAALSVATYSAPRLVRVGGASAAASLGPDRSALCPRGTLPDGEVCVPVPARGAARDAGAPSARARAEHDRIARRPDRDADYSKYRLPVELLPQSRVEATHFPAARGTPVHLVRLEHQEGDAEVLHAGELPGLPGAAVVTRHAVRDASGLREYLSLFANLERIEPGIARGAALGDGRRIGTVGDTAGSPALDYEVRRLRSGSQARELEPDDYAADARTVGVDARNVLPPR